MEKVKKNRSGSLSNEAGKAANTGDRRKTSQPGSSAKSNRQTGKNKLDESVGAERNTTKKGANSI